MVYCGHSVHSLPLLRLLDVDFVLLLAENGAEFEFKVLHFADGEESGEEGENGNADRGLDEVVESVVVVPVVEDNDGDDRKEGWKGRNNYYRYV